jgi:hypothetical protein
VSNPFNPLEWLRSAQDWFVKTERSSGFRPYLIFLFIVCGLSLSLLWMAGDKPDIRLLAVVLVGTSFGGFVILFAIKSFQEPDFCRSETHVRQMKRLELEYMGSESESLPAEVVEEQPAIEAPPVQSVLPAGSEEDDE